MIRKEVIDDVLVENDLRAIQRELMWNDMFPWYFTDEIVRKGEKTIHDGWYGYHIFYEARDMTSENYRNRLDLSHVNISSFTHILRPVVDVLKPRALVRIKGNFYPKTTQVDEAERHHDLHAEPSHQGAIFFVNTCNGFTRLADGEKVMSVENRLLLFDASELHNSSTCSDEKGRFNVNFNYYG